MGKIVVFDSGLGSLSVINAIREATLSNMTYFADQRYFPYGVRSVADLRKIITERITMLEEKFRPEMIIVGSNTPTLLLGKLPGKNTLGVLPPLAKAASATKTGGVAVLATHSVWRSGSLLKYIRDSDVEKNGIVVNRIDCSELVNLVESGEFATSNEKCVHVIRKILRVKFEKNHIDSATLSSTHLPFLLPILQKEFPNVKFFDPAKDIARTVKKRLAPSPRNRLSVYTSSDVKIMQKKLELLQIKRRVSFLA